jgi:hypothetical protein
VGELDFCGEKNHSSRPLVVYRILDIAEKGVVTLVDGTEEVITSGDNLVFV